MGTKICINVYVRRGSVANEIHQKSNFGRPSIAHRIVTNSTSDDCLTSGKCLPANIYGEMCEICRSGAEV